MPRKTPARRTAATGIRRFNEAAARCRGKPASTIRAVSTGSMLQ